MFWVHCDFFKIIEDSCNKLHFILFIILFWLIWSQETNFYFMVQVNDTPAGQWFTEFAHPGTHLLYQMTCSHKWFELCHVNKHASIFSFSQNFKTKFYVHQSSEPAAWKTYHQLPHFPHPCNFWHCLLMCIAELELGTECVVEMDSQQTILHHSDTLDKMERWILHTLNKYYIFFIKKK